MNVALVSREVVVDGAAYLLEPGHQGGVSGRDSSAHTGTSPDAVL